MNGRTTLEFRRWSALSYDNRRADLRRGNRYRETFDIPASNPWYIHVREGDRIIEGDVRSRTEEELESPTLSKWRIESITEDTVTGIEIKTGEIEE